jgi:hypothetical protein
MTIAWIFGGVLLCILLITLSVFFSVSGLSWPKKNRDNTQSNKGSRNENEPGLIVRKWNQAKHYLWDAVVIVGGIGLCHRLIWFLWPDFWLEWYALKGFYFFQVCLAIGFMIFVMKSRFHKTIGFVMIILSFIGVFSNIGNALNAARDAELVLRNDSVFLKPSPNPEELIKRPFLGRNAEVEMFTKKFFRDRLPSKFAEAMIVIAERESQFNQNEKDGTPYRGRQNWKDVGVMQINEDTWLRKSQSLGYNIYTLEGNLKFALWLFQKEGFKPWKSSVPEKVVPRTKIPRSNSGNQVLGNERPDNIIIFAPVGEWSEPIKVNGMPLIARPEGDVKVRNDKGQEFYAGPHKIPSMEKTETLEYMALGNEPVKVIISFR